MARSSKKQNYEAWAPASITDWVNELPKNGKTERYRARFQRFAEYWGRDDLCAKKIENAWHTLSSSAKSDDDLLTLFCVMPDQPENQPFTAIYGKRVVDPGEERARYNKDLEAVKAVIALINPHRKRFDELMSDAQATPDAHAAAIRLRSMDTGFMACLRALEDLLVRVDPTAKIITKQWASKDAAKKSYVILVASLNRYLSTPQHAALAFLANVNCQTLQIKADQIRKAWARGADKRT